MSNYPQLAKWNNTDTNNDIDPFIGSVMAFQLLLICIMLKDALNMDTKVIGFLQNNSMMETIRSCVRTIISRIRLDDYSNSPQDDLYEHNTYERNDHEPLRHTCKLCQEFECLVIPSAWESKIDINGETYMANPNWYKVFDVAEKLVVKHGEKHYAARGCPIWINKFSEDELSLIRKASEGHTTKNNQVCQCLATTSK